MTEAKVTDAMIERWRSDRSSGMSLQRIALRDGVSDWTVRHHTRDVVVPKRRIPQHQKPNPVPRRNRRIAIQPNETEYPEPAYAEERPQTRLRQKLAEIRERAA